MDQNPTHAGASLEAEESVTPLSARGEEVIQNNLPDYLAMASKGSSINGYAVEAAEEAVEFLPAALLDEDALDEQASSIDPRIQALRARAIADRAIREADERAEGIEREKTRAERMDAWQKGHYEIGGQDFTGEDLDRISSFLKDPAKKAAMAKKLAGEHGWSDDQAREKLRQAEEYIELLRRRELGEKLSEEEKRRLQELQADPDTGTVLVTLRKEQARYEAEHGLGTKTTGATAAAHTTSAASGADAIAAANTADPIMAPAIKAGPLTPAFTRGADGSVPLTVATAASTPAPAKPSPALALSGFDV